MKSVKVKLNKPLKEEYYDELRKRIFFVASEITNFQINVEDNVINSIDLDILDEGDTAEISKKLIDVVENEIAKQIITAPKIIWQSKRRIEDFDSEIFQKMTELGMAYEVAEGQVCFAEPMITLMDALDEKFREIAVDKLNAEEHVYPTLISSESLKKCGYFDSFPHMLMFVTRLHNDIDVYQKFLKDYENGVGLKNCVLDNADNVDYCLPPTMCYHTYDLLRGKEMKKPNRVITSKGKSFRHESKYYKTIERLWDFTIREIVFLGDKDFVVSCREKFMKETFKFIDSLGLMGHSEVANDPFFCNTNTAAKIINQRMLELKYELRLNIANEKTISVASFNFHDKFFGKRFNISQNNEQISSGCVGFGIERFAYAFVCQYGVDPKNWPKFSEKLKNL